MFKNQSEEKTKYKNTKNVAKKVLANYIRKEAERVDKIERKTENMFTLVKFMKKDGKDIGGRCMREQTGKLGFSEKDNKRSWKNHIKEIMIKKRIGTK